MARTWNQVPAPLRRRVKTAAIDAMASFVVLILAWRAERIAGRAAFAIIADASLALFANIRFGHTAKIARLENISH
jgi:ACR3 family arsenite efflux pump ArsB